MGIVLAVCGAGLYFLRSFKPALARDYDVFFAAIGLLCGGILFFQGWRLDPILQFGQFLLAGTTVFFAYESVRLRGVATDQARRSSYFDDEPSREQMPGGGLRDGWDDSYDQFAESPPLRRRFSGRDIEGAESSQEDFYRSRRTSRAAIPEEAASRSFRNRSISQDSWNDESENSRRRGRFERKDEGSGSTSSFGERRNLRQEERRGSRPSVNQRISSRRSNIDDEPRRSSNPSRVSNRRGSYSSGRSEGPNGPSTSIANQAEDAAFSPSRAVSPREKNPKNSSSQVSSRFTGKTKSDRSTPNTRRRDNSSRFDD